MVRVRIMMRRALDGWRDDEDTRVREMDWRSHGDDAERHSLGMCGADDYGMRRARMDGAMMAVSWGHAGGLDGLARPWGRRGAAGALGFSGQMTAGCCGSDSEKACGSPYPRGIR